MSAILQEETTHSNNTAAPCENITPVPLPKTVPRILVVEDTLIWQLTSKGMLEKIGCKEIDIVSDGKQALAMMLAGNGYDLVFMDINLVDPEVTGMDVVREFRASKKHLQTRIVALTMNDPMKLPIDFLCNIDAYVHKTAVSVEVLQAVVFREAHNNTQRFWLGSSTLTGQIN